ncbi:hypothetical protein HPB47_021784, partial [Ixodes persulcatus]
MKKKTKGSRDLVRKLSGRSFSDLARHLNIGDPELGSSAMSSQQEHGPLSVSAFNVKLPPFRTSVLDLWFLQVESRFAARRITAALTKYHHEVSSLPPATACEIRDLLFAPPAEDAYKTLKTTLLQSPRGFKNFFAKRSLATAHRISYSVKCKNCSHQDDGSQQHNASRTLSPATSPKAAGDMVLIFAAESNLSKLAELA